MKLTCTGHIEYAAIMRTTLGTHCPLTVTLTCSVLKCYGKYITKLHQLIYRFAPDTPRARSPVVDAQRGRRARRGAGTGYKIENHHPCFELSLYATRLWMGVIAIFGHTVAHARH